MRRMGHSLWHTWLPEARTRARPNRVAGGGAANDSGSGPIDIDVLQATITNMD